MKLLIPFFLFIALLGGCEQMATDQTITRTQLDEELKNINEFIASAICTASEQCRYIAYGSKGCGGPQGYLVYPESVDEEALQEMVALYTAREQTFNRENEVMSDCSMPSPPQGVQCSDGKCIESV